MNYTLKNNLLEVTVSTFGAELQSIRNIRTGEEYLWQGNPQFWKRRSPVLFPIVGSVWDGVFRMDGKEYPMSQHGFARDMEFTPVETDSPDELLFALESSEETLAKYPRQFRLEIGYRLEEARITVMWRITNTDNRQMDFQIGAHPAFNLPEFSTSDKIRGYISFDADNLESQTIAEKGCFGRELKTITPDSEGMLPLEADTFSNDALVFADSRVHRASILDKNRRPLLTLLFSTPYLGIWAPCGEAPFVCIEPWYGRADSTGFKGDFSERPAVNRLAPDATFNRSYMIIIDNL